MNALPFIDLFGYWLGIFLTLAILSFLYKDNPFYKFAEHLFIGTSIGYVVIQQYYNVLRPKLIESIGGSEHWYWNLHLIPLILVVMMFMKVASRRLGWMGRYPLAIVVALYAGLQMNGAAQGDLGQQIKRASSDIRVAKVNINDPDVGTSDLRRLPGFTPAIAEKVVARRAIKPFKSLDEIAAVGGLSPAAVDELKSQRGWVVGLDARATVRSGRYDIFASISQLLMFFGLLASLIYFYFSIEHKGIVGRVSRFGVWVLMIGFGASFGFTVMGRLSLAIGRVQTIRGDKLPKEIADRVHGPLVALISIVIIVAGLVVWELYRRKSEPPSSSGNSGSGDGGGGGSNAVTADAAAQSAQQTAAAPGTAPAHEMSSSAGQLPAS